MKIPVYFWFELLAFAVCLISFIKIRHTVLKWFLPFLGLIVVYEYGVLSRWSFLFINRSNHWLANIISTIEIVFYSLLYYHFIQSPQIKKIIRYTLAGFILLTILNILFLQGYNRFHTITYRLGSAMVIVFICMYFKQLMNTENVTLTMEPMFWISSGLFFFLLGFIFYLSAFDFIAYQSIKKHASLYKVIRYSLIIQMYSLFAIAFLCKKNV